MSRAGDAVAPVVEPVVVANGYDLEGLSVTTAGRRRLVRVVIDRDGGVTLDDAAAISRDISAALDEADPMGATAYVLEVTSPGVDRPLTLPRHWRRNLGRLVRVTLPDEAFDGRVVACTEDAVTLETEGTTREVALSTIDKAIVQVELNRKEAASEPDDADDN